MMRKIGVLTSGGDAPGMNAAVMSIARSAAAYGMPLIGIKHGYNGLLRKSTSIRWLSVPPDTRSKPLSRRAFARAAAFSTVRRA